jgi:hypothetical protein
MGEMSPVPLGSAPKRIVDVSIKTWCSKEVDMVDKPYNYMHDDSMHAYQKTE